MKVSLVKKLLVLLLLINHMYAYAQTENRYFQQKVDFRIEVTLNDLSKTLDGFLENYPNNYHQA